MATQRNQILQAITRTIRQVVPHGSQAILFGSQARGDAHSDSDWDVLILLDKDRIALADYDNYGFPLRELGWSLGETINTVLLTQKEWKKGQANPFQQNVSREGIVLWA